MVSKLNANRKPGEAFGGAMKRIYGDIGFGGLWNGLVLRIFMIGTLTSLRKWSFCFYQIKFRADCRCRMGYLRFLQGLHGLPNNRWGRTSTRKVGGHHQTKQPLSR